MVTPTQRQVADFAQATATELQQLKQCLELLHTETKRLNSVIAVLNEEVVAIREGLQLPR